MFSISFSSDESNVRQSQRWKYYRGIYFNICTCINLVDASEDNLRGIKSNSRTAAKLAIVFVSELGRRTSENWAMRCHSTPKRSWNTKSRQIHESFLNCYIIGVASPQQSSTILNANMQPQCTWHFKSIPSSCNEIPLQKWFIDIHKSSLDFMSRQLLHIRCPVTWILCLWKFVGTSSYFWKCL